MLYNKSSNFLFIISLFISFFLLRYMHFIRDNVFVLNLNKSGSNTNPFIFSMSEIHSSINLINIFTLFSLISIK